MPNTVIAGFTHNFLGKAPVWYKQVILLFLIANPVVMYVLGPGVAGWLLIGEFIFTLAMALKCYPLLPGGLLAVEALLIGLTSADAVYHEVLTNFPVILLLMFMVAGIYFMKELLLVTFTQILVGVRSKSALSLLFCSAAAVLSAFLDALTVTAVIISVAVGFFSVYHKVASGKGYQQKDHNTNSDDEVIELHREDLENFRAFLRSLLMHGAIGTALGGVATMVGEPQNLLIAKVVGWDFAGFFLHMAPVSLPVLAAGLYFREGIAELLTAWQTPEYSHGPLIPLLSGLLFLRQLKEFPERPGPVADRWPGVALLALALLLALGGKLLQIGDIVAYALILWVGALLIVPTTFLSSTTVAAFMLQAFAAAVVGGFASLPGSLLGGLLIGILMNLFTFYVSPEFSSTFLLAVILLALNIFPNGVLARVGGTRV